MEGSQTPGVHHPHSGALARIPKWLWALGDTEVNQAAGPGSDLRGFKEVPSREQLCVHFCTSKWPLLIFNPYTCILNSTIPLAHTFFLDIKKCNIYNTTFLYFLQRKSGRSSPFFWSFNLKKGETHNALVRSNKSVIWKFLICGPK